MSNYSAIGALALVILLWLAILFDTGNILHNISESLHLIEKMVKTKPD
ncbi:hypothetical protein [Buttiauxella gaviniae]